MISYAVMASVIILFAVVAWLIVANQITINDARKHAKKSGYDVDENSYS